MATTVASYIQEARAAIEAGDLDKAEELKRKAQAVKALDELEGEAIKAAPEVNRLPFSDGPAIAQQDKPDIAVKSWYVKKFGELDSATNQISRELYGRDYDALAYQKQAAFLRYIKTGHAEDGIKRLMLLTPLQMLDIASSGMGIGHIKATMIESNDELGGFVVPEDFRASVIDRLPGLTVVRSVANVMTTSRDRLTMPKATGGDSRYTGAVRATWVDESPSSSAAATNATFGNVNIPVHTLMAHVDLSNNLLEDAAVNLAQYLSRQMASAFAIKEDEAFLVGDGVGKPQGILNGTAASGAPFDADVTTVNSTSASLLTLDGIKKIPTELAAQYRQAGAVWVMAKATRQALELLKDGNGRYLWGDNNTNLGPNGNQLIGYNVRESEAMPSIAANKYPILFGDFQGYTIADRVGLSVQRYEDSTTAKTNVVTFVARYRVGGQVTEGWRFVAQKVAV